jgi:hypothetical protein
MKKLLVLFLLAVSSVIILPTQGDAKTADSKNIVETNTEPVAQRRNRRGWQGRRWRGRDNRYGQYRRNRRVRLVRQTYWRNGRRYTRVVRVYR